MKTLKSTIISLLGALVAATPLYAETLTLSRDDVRQMALASDEDVQIADNQLTQASLDRGIAKTAYLPNFSASATGVYRVPDTKNDFMTLQMRGLYMAGINLTQPIYAGGKIVAANKLAKIGEDISRQQNRMTRMDVIANADNSYWTYIAVLEKVKMTQAYLQQIDSIYESTRRNYETGMITRNDLLRIEARRSQVEYNLNQATAGADLCRQSLCRVIGVDYATEIIPTDTTVPVPEVSSYERSVDQRPEVEMLSSAIEARQQQVKMARADFLPTVGLQLGWSAFGNLKYSMMMQGADGQYHELSDSYNSNGFMGLLSVSIPIFHWGEGCKKVRKAKLDVENAILDKAKKSRLMELELSNAITNVETGRQLITSAETAMRQAEENLSAMNARYRTGMITLTDLLDAQSQWQVSYANLIEARTQYQINLTSYRRAAGILE
jgi:outer membrane protein TolC